MNITRIIICAVSVSSVGFATGSLFDKENKGIASAGLELAESNNSKKRGRPAGDYAPTTKTVKSKRVAGPGLVDVTNIIEGSRKRKPNSRFEQDDHLDGRPDSSKRPRKIKIESAAIERVVPAETASIDASRAVLDRSGFIFDNVRSTDYISSDDETQHSLVASSASCNSNTPSKLNSVSYFDSSPFANLALGGLGLGSPDLGSNDDFFGVTNPPVAVHESPFLSGSSSGVLPGSEVKSISGASFAWTQSPAEISIEASSSLTPMSQALGGNLVWGNSPFTPLVGASFTPASVRSALSGLLTPFSPGIFERLVEFYGK